MSCPHLPDSHLKCPECAAKAVQDWKDSKYTHDMTKIRESVRRISRLNKMLRGEKVEEEDA